MHSAARVIVPALLPRATVMWVLVRLLVALLPVGIGQAFGSLPPSPLAVVLVCGIVGMVDVRMRGERLLWANLGVPRAALFAVYAATAIPAEVVVALLHR